MSHMLHDSRSGEEEERSRNYHSDTSILDTDNSNDDFDSDEDMSDNEAIDEDDIPCVPQGEQVVVQKDQRLRKFEPYIRLNRASDTVSSGYRLQSEKVSKLC